VEKGFYQLFSFNSFSNKVLSQRVRQFPGEYACVGCNLKVTDHETLIEKPEDRLARGASVGEDYIPFENKYESFPPRK
jgi:hypothetical protein